LYVEELTFPLYGFVAGLHWMTPPLKWEDSTSPARQHK